MNIVQKTIVYAVFALGLCGAPAMVHADNLDCTNLSYDKILSHFIALDALGMEATITLHNCDIENIRKSSTIRSYLDYLNKTLKISSFEQAKIAHFSDSKKNTGYGFTLQTAQVTLWGYFINNSNTAIITVFSRQPFNPNSIAKTSKEFFGTPSTTYVTDVNIKVIDGRKGL